MLTHFWHESEINQMPQDGEIGKYVVPKGYVNASQMCKANGKFLADYTKLKSTKQYLQALSNDIRTYATGTMRSLANSTLVL